MALSGSSPLSIFMSLLRILDRKPSQVPMTISAAEVDATETANHSGPAAAINVSGADTQRSVLKEISATKNPSLHPGALKFEEGAQSLIPRSCLIEDI